MLSRILATAYMQNGRLAYSQRAFTHEIMALGGWEYLAVLSAVMYQELVEIDSTIDLRNVRWEVLVPRYQAEIQTYLAGVTGAD